MTFTAVQGPKRFYAQALAASHEEGFTVLLDGRAAKTPTGKLLQLPTEPLSRLIAQEWDAQTGNIEFSEMPMTRLAFTALDRTPNARSQLTADIARHVQHDLICHLADEPERLVLRQEAQWAPWRAWAQVAIGAPFLPVRGLLGGAQSMETVLAAQALADREGDFALTGLAQAAALLGSGALAFALRYGALSADAAFDASRVDEAYQEEAWGVDPEALARTNALRLEARRLEAWFTSL